MKWPCVQAVQAVLGSGWCGERWWGAHRVWSFAHARVTRPASPCLLEHPMHRRGAYEATKLLCAHSVDVNHEELVEKPCRARASCAVPGCVVQHRLVTTWAARRQHVDQADESKERL